MSEYLVDVVMRFVVTAEDEYAAFSKAEENAIKVLGPEKYEEFVFEVRDPWQIA